MARPFTHSRKKRETILRLFLQGEKACYLAAKFNVSLGYPSKLKYNERYNNRRTGATSK